MKTSTLDMGTADFGLLQELVSKVLWESALEGVGVHECWSLFNSHVLAQEQAIPRWWKTSKWSRRPAWLTRDLLNLRQKRKV